MNRTPDAFAARRARTKRDPLLLLALSLCLDACGKDSAGRTGGDGQEADLGGAPQGGTPQDRNQSGGSENSNGGTSPKNSGGGSGGEGGNGGTASGGEGGSQFGAGGTSGASGWVECLADADCPPLGPCESARCSEDGICEATSREGQECTSSCVPSGTCEDGACVGVRSTTTGELKSSLFAFGGASDSRVQHSGGGAVFLDSTHLVYADRLLVGTWLSLVAVEGDTLRVVDTHLTSVHWGTTPVSSQVWETVPTTHLVSWVPDRFALVDGNAGIQTFSVEGASLKRLSRFWPSRGTWTDAVATSDGQIFVCDIGMKTYQVDEDGEVETGPSYPSTGGLRLFVGADRDTVHGMDLLSERSFRFKASEGPSSVSFDIPKGPGLDLSAQGPSTFLVQRAALHGAKGDLQLFDLSQSAETPTQSWSQDVRTLPLGGTFLGSGLLLKWRREVAPSVFQMQSEWWELGASSPALTHVERVRHGSDDSPKDATRFEVLENLVVAQPFRQLMQLDQATPALKVITGLGQGTLDQGLFEDENHLALISADSSHRVLVDGEQMTFIEGGPLEGGSQARHRLLMPTEAQRSWLTPFAAPLYLEEQEPVQLIRIEAGKERLVLSLDAAPGLLLQRENDLLHVEAASNQSLFLRHSRLTQDNQLLKLGEVQVPHPFHELMLVDFDPSTASFALATCLGEEVEMTFGRLGQGTSHYHDSIALDECPLSLAAQEDRLIVFDEQGLQLWSLSELGATLLEERSEAEVPPMNSVLGSTDDDQLLLFGFNTELGKPALGVLDTHELRILSQNPVVDRVTALAAQGNQLMAITKASLHQFAPTCAPATSSPPEWPIADADEERPDERECKPINPCLSWEAPEVAGDVNRNGCVDGDDLAVVGNCLNSTVDTCNQSVLADLDGDGRVSISDYQTVLNLLASGGDCSQTSHL